MIVSVLSVMLKQYLTLLGSGRNHFLLARDGDVKGMSTAIKILLVAVVLMVVTVIVLGMFDVRLSSANEMLAQLSQSAFGNITQVLSGTSS